MGSKVGRCATGVGLLTYALAFGACGGELSVAQKGHARRVVAMARELGAYHCAGRELALAQAHLEFAAVEEANGDLARARFHLSETELYAAAAARLSIRAGCGQPAAKAGLATFAGARGHRPSDSDRDGVPDLVDLCPGEAEDRDGFQDDDGCLDADNDGDLVPDGEDGCFELAEDLDGFEDDDGCPEPDNDQDGIPDVRDACAMTPAEDYLDGCPAGVYPGVRLEDHQVAVSRSIPFVPKGAQLVPEAWPVMGTVAQLLVDHPQVQVEIQVHTDSRGEAAANLKLSRRRAESVRDFLVSLGIDGARLRTAGFGETRPLVSNSTSLGRERNRRVEFARLPLRESE